MSWKKKLLKSFRLYAITDLEEENSVIIKKVNEALQGGADILQLRSKTLSDAALLRLARKMLPLCRKHRKLFFINDRVDLVLASGADGVHLGQDDMPYRDARRILGSKFFIGRSTHSLPQALKAAREGHDYIGVGPVFETPTKPDYVPVGLKLVGEVAAKVSVPFVAIGGIDSSSLGRVIEAGANSIACVRAIFSSKNVQQSVKELLKQYELSLACRRNRCD